jgi:hypothetical protein
VGGVRTEEKKMRVGRLDKRETSLSLSLSREGCVGTAFPLSDYSSYMGNER